MRLYDEFERIWGVKNINLGITSDQFPNKMDNEWVAYIEQG